MSPRSSASVSSHGGTPPGSPRNGSMSSAPRRAPRPKLPTRVPSRPTQALRVVAHPLHQPVGRRPVELEAGSRHLLVDPGRHLAPGTGVDLLAAARLDGVGERLGDAARAPHEHERRGRQRVGQIADERRDLVGPGEDVEVTTHDDAPVGEERRCLRRVHQRVEARVAAVGGPVPLGAHLLDGEALVEVADAARGPGRGPRPGGSPRRRPAPGATGASSRTSVTLPRPGPPGWRPSPRPPAGCGGRRSCG